MTLSWEDHPPVTTAYLSLTDAKEIILFPGCPPALWATFEEAIPGSPSSSPFLLASSKVSRAKSTYLGLFTPHLV